MLLAAALPTEPRPVVARDPVLLTRRFSDDLVERIEADAAALPLLGLIPGPREAPPGRPGRPGCPRCDGSGTATRTATGQRVSGHRCLVCRERTSTRSPR